MKYTLIDWEQSNDSFWRAYNKLFNKSEHKSPFYAENFLRTLVNEINFKAFFLVAESKEEEFLLVLPLRYFPKYIGFMAEGHSDHNPVLIDKSLDDETASVACSELLKLAGNKNIYFKNVPPWGKSLSALSFASKTINRKLISFESWDCPTVEHDESGGLTSQEFFHKQFNKSRLRTYHNKIKALPQYELLIEEDLGNDIEGWVNEFCYNHEYRWNKTETPSQYQNILNRQLLLAKIKAHHTDATAVRFTISVENRRIAMVLCLKQGERLIYGLPSFAPDYDYTHPGSVMVTIIGKWAGENGYTILDFGVGGEEYKFRFATHNRKVFRVYLPVSEFSVFSFKALFDKAIKEKELLQKLWSKFVLGFYRTKFKNSVSTFKTSLKKKIILQKEDNLYIVRKLVRKLKGKKEYFYLKYHSDAKVETNYTIRKLSFYETLDFLDKEISLTLAQRVSYIERYSAGKCVPYGIIDENKVIQISWIRKSNENDLLPKNECTEHYIIYDCFTAVAYRGKGLYPLMLKYLTSLFTPGTCFIIYTDDWNVASQRGILKAGFLPFAEKNSDTIKLLKNEQS